MSTSPSRSLAGNRHIDVLPSLMMGPDAALAQACLAADRACRELAESNPALFYLLLRMAAEEDLGVADICRLCGLPRVRLLAAMGSPGGAATERLLRRCVFMRLENDEFLVLRALATLSPPRWLQHLPHIHLTLLAFAPWPAWPMLASVLGRLTIGDPAFAAAIADGSLPARRDLVDALEQVMFDLLEIGEMIAAIGDEPEPGQPSAAARQRQLARCRSFTELSALHADLFYPEDHWHDLVHKAVANRPWPAAPLAGNRTIEPIASADEVLWERARMHHCVPSYASRVMQGEGYLYRVLAPERATLYLSHVEGRWRVNELRRACNKPASPATRATVEAWLAGSTEASSAHARTSAYFGPS